MMMMRRMPTNQDFSSSNEFGRVILLPFLCVQECDDPGDEIWTICTSLGVAGCGGVIHSSFAFVETRTRENEVNRTNQPTNSWKDTFSNHKEECVMRTRSSPAPLRKDPYGLCCDQSPTSLSRSCFTIDDEEDLGREWRRKRTCSFCLSLFSLLPFAVVLCKKRREKRGSGDSSRRRTSPTYTP